MLVCTTQIVRVAGQLIKDFNLRVGKGSYPFRGHLKINGEVRCGIISVSEDETPASLKSKLYWHEGDIFVRKLDQSPVAVVAFVGRKVPPYINYNFEYVMLRRYKTIIPACYKCGTVGYWVDNCPYPETGPCHQCGKTMADASSAGAQHECLPTCLICGDGHLTGSTTCKGKFRPAQKSARPPRQQLDRGQQKPQYGNRGKSPPENSNAGARPWNRQKQPRKQQTSETVTPEELPSMMPGEFPALE